jgi:hypothetical protein
MCALAHAVLGKLTGAGADLSFLPLWASSAVWPAFLCAIFTPLGAIAAEIVHPEAAPVPPVEKPAAEPEAETVEK